MYKRYAFKSLAVAAAAALSLAGCAGSGSTDDRAAQSQSGAQAGARSGEASATTFADAASRGLHLDYDKLATPAGAVAAGKLIVRGTLLDVTEGITFGGVGAAQAGRASSYVTFVVGVDATLKGTAAKGAKIHAVVNKSTAVGAGDLAKLNKNLKIVLVLDDISGWTPAPGVTVVRPAGAPATGPLYHAFPDGLWLQGGADQAMVGIHAHPEDLSAAWGKAGTLDQYWATLEKAAKGG